jgi:hypothetical protein
MKKILLLSVFFFTVSIFFAQNTSSNRDVGIESLLTKIDSTLNVTNQWLQQIELDQSLKSRYKLYQTENIYILLQLDTKTGKIKILQWSLDSDKELTVVLNDVDLTFGYGHGSGTFELYPTKNMYQFILLDKTDGRMWHVQWGTESSKQWIRRID